MNFGDFTDGGNPGASDYIAGYADGGAAGSDRRWLRSTFANPSTDAGLALGSSSLGWKGLNIGRSDTAVSPALNSSVYIDLVNTANTGSNGGQIRFAATAGSPYAMISSSLLDGTAPGSGYLAFAIKDGASGTLRNRLWITPGEQGTLLSTDDPTTHSVATFTANFSAWNTESAQNFIGYTRTSDNPTTPSATISGYFVGDHDATSNVAAWGIYAEGRASYHEGTSFGAEIDVQNTTLGRTPSNITPYAEFGDGAGPALVAIWTNASGTYTPSSASFTGTISNTTLTVSGVSGTIAIGQYVRGSGVTTNTKITAGSGTTWTVDLSQTVGPVAMTSGGYGDASAGISITGSGQTDSKFYKGIVVDQNAVKTVSGHMEVLAMPSTAELTWYDSGANVGRLYSTDALTLTWNGTAGLSVTATTASTTPTTGALIVSGGVGIAKTATVGGGTIAANTSADGLVLLDSTAATSGNQQFSPRIRLTGQGWKTDATPASQAVDYVIEQLPAQGTANPTSQLVFKSQINGGGYRTITTVSDFSADTQFIINNTTSAAFIAATGGTNRAWLYGDSAQVFLGALANIPIKITINGAEVDRIHTSGGISIGSTTDPGAGGLLVGGSTASTSTTTGALVVTGGVGIGGAVNIGSTTKLSVGSNSAAPLLFQGGTNLTSAADGAMEFDGQALFFSPDASDRRIIPTIAITRLHAGYTLADSTTLQKIFNASANGTLTLPVGSYIFECVIGIDAMSATSGNAALSIIGAGGATVTNTLQVVVGIDGAKATAGAAAGASWSATNDVPAANTSVVTAGVSTEMSIMWKGSFEVTGGGTIIPSVDLITGGVTPVVKLGSYFMCWRMGAATDVTQGNWS